MRKRLFDPRVWASLLVGVALLGGLLAFSGVGQAVQLMRHFQPAYLLVFLFALLGYEVLRLVEWHFLLDELGLRVPFRTRVLTFATGEVTKSLPLGNFVPDYLLQRTHGADFGLASAATFLITLVEVGVALGIVAIFGIPGWGWVRPLIVFGVLAFALLAWAAVCWYRWYSALARRNSLLHRLLAPLWVRRLLHTKLAQTALTEVRQFGVGEVRLLRPRVLGWAAAMCATYLGFSGSAFYLVARGLGIEHLTWEEALAALCFSLAFAAIVPLPMDLGSTEISGTAVLVVMGLGRADAVSLMLLDRVFSLAAVILIALVVMAVLRREMREVLTSHAHLEAVEAPLEDAVPRVLPAASSTRTGGTLSRSEVQRAARPVLHTVPCVTLVSPERASVGSKRHSDMHDGECRECQPQRERIGA